MGALKKSRGPFGSFQTSQEEPAIVGASLCLHGSSSERKNVWFPLGEKMGLMTETKNPYRRFGGGKSLKPKINNEANLVGLGGKPNSD